MYVLFRNIEEVVPFAVRCSVACHEIKNFDNQ